MKKCLVGISGGVDSLFAALKLKKEGYDVLCVNLKMHSNESLPNSAVEFLKENRIEYYYADYIKEFKEYVIDYFLKEYMSGYTPNPCVICNRDVKMKMLYKEALKNGIEFIATGHYADFKKGFLMRHKSKKDQSYFLACVDREILNHTIFPLNDYTKEQVKSIFSNYEKDSSDLCFVKKDYRVLLKKKFGEIKGKIIKNNKVVGYHNGFFNYTVGQRKGLQIEGIPHYVIAIDAKNNTIYAGTEDKLYTSEFFLDDLQLYEKKTFFDDKRVECFVRYGAKPKVCSLDVKKKKVALLERERAVTPGQIAVFYYEDRVVACGRIGYGIY